MDFEALDRLDEENRMRDLSRSIAIDRSSFGMDSLAEGGAMESTSYLLSEGCGDLDLGLLSDDDGDDDGDSDSGGGGGDDSGDDACDGRDANKTKQSAGSETDDLPVHKRAVRTTVESLAFVGR